MRTHYENQTTYSQEFIQAMTKMTYDLFHPEVSGRIYLISIAMMFAGGMGSSYSDNAFFMVLLALGCFVIMSAEYGAKATAKQIVASLKGSFPLMKFSFRQDNIVVTTPDASGAVHYDIIVRLAENHQYLFLFSSERAAYVLDKTGFTEGSVEEFKAFIQEKTGGLPVERNASILAKMRAGIKKR